MSIQDIISLIKQSYHEWSEDKASRLAAAMAYYTVFSIPPLLIIAIAIAGRIFGDEAARGQIEAQFSGVFGPTAAEAIQAAIENASEPSGSLAATLFGLALLLFGASGVFAQLQDTMNTIWEVAPRPDRSIWETIKDRFFSFTMVLGIAFLLLVSLIVSAALAALDTFLSGLVPGAVVLMQIINFIISFGVVTFLFTLIFKVVPDVEIAWSDVWVGALVTAALFVLGREIISLYLGENSTASTYGAAGSLVALLLWVYYSAQILFFGAEFTQVYANRYGSRIVASENAVPVTEEARAQQGIPHRETLAAAAAGGQATYRRVSRAEPAAQRDRATQEKEMPFYLVAILSLFFSLLRRARNR